MSGKIGKSKGQVFFVYLFIFCSNCPFPIFQITFEKKGGRRAKRRYWIIEGKTAENRIKNRGIGKLANQQKGKKYWRIGGEMGESKGMGIRQRKREIGKREAKERLIGRG